MATPTQQPQSKSLTPSAGIIRAGMPKVTPLVETTFEPKILHVKIRNREKILYEGEARSITSYNEKGTFDILGKHANFISLIKNFLTIRKPDGTKEEMKIDDGLMQVLNNDVLIFIGIVNFSFLAQEVTSQNNPAPPVSAAPAQTPVKK